MTQSPRARAVIPFFVPWTDRSEIEQVTEAIRSGWLTTGPKVERLERGVARLVRARHAIAVNSCTAALHLALAAAGVGPGDEVITSPYTFAATGETILYLGARPVFVDIVPQTLNLDAARIARAITRRTRAIVPVHIAGLPCEMRPILDLARRRGLWVIDDAAHALGTAIGPRRIGSISDMTCFSFYATKNLTTGEGGLITTGDTALASRLRRLSLHGLTRNAWKRYTRRGSWRYDIVEMGYKYNMTDVAAGLGLAQLEKFSRMQARRRALARRYSEALGGEEGFELPAEVERTTHAWHLYILRLRRGRLRIGRDALIERLRERGIGTSVHFLPLHLHSLYRKRFGYRRGAYPVSEDASSRALSLPLYPGLTDADQDRVIDSLLELASKNRR